MAGQNLRRTGAEYERRAAAYLEQHGVRILEINYRTRFGEIDLIGQDGSYLVFFEVKYRRDLRRGYPLEAVNFKKQNQIIKTARSYLYERHCSEKRAVRFDCVAFLNRECSWVKNAFSVG